MAKDVIITPADGDIQFENSTGTEAGKIEQSGDDLVLSNAVGDILIGDGTADVYIGDGAANVDIVFEQNGSIRGEAGSSVDITLGSSDTDVIISGSTFNIDPDAAFSGQITTTQNQITSNIGTTSAIRLKPGATTNTTGKSSIFLGTSPVDNYGISLRGARLGNDGTPTFELATHVGSANGTVALSIDNSQNATFAGNVSLTGGSLSISGDGSNAATLTESSAGILTIAAVDDIILDAEGDIALDANGGDIRLRDGGTTFGTFTKSGNNFHITSNREDGYIKFFGNDGGTSVTALTLNMADGGNATFAGTVTSPTFLGDLNGTINTATTGTTQTAGNNSTKIATTAYADAAAGAVPIGNYLPLAGGTMNASANINMNSGTLSSVDSIDFGIGQLNGVSTSNLILKSLGDITYNVDSNNNGNSSHIFQESANELMRIRYDGNVGIGETSPDAKLHIVDDTQFASGQASVEVLKLQRKNTGGDIKATTEGHISMWATDSNNNTEWGRISWVNDNAADGGLETEGAMSFWTSRAGTLTRAMYIDHDQKVGINKTNPTQALDVNGSIAVEGETVIGSSTGFLDIGQSTATAVSKGLKFHSDETLAMTIDTYANVGIGTTSPSSKLEVYASGSTVLDIQGSQGQLFSITDDLTGDLFTVSDISGVPIFNVNASGTSNFDGNLNLGDNNKIQLGASQDLQMYHDGTNSYIVDAGAGDLLNYYSNDWKVIQYGSSEVSIWARTNEYVKLFYNGNEKLATTNTGVEVTGELEATSLDINGNADISGNLVIAGTVDGVDISALPTTFAPTNAEQNVQSDWNATSGDALILNKPTIPTDHGDHDGLYLPIGGGTLTGNLNIPEYLYHAGDTDTYLRFRGDDLQLVAGGRNIIRMDEGTDPDKVQLGDSSTVTYTEGSVGIGITSPATLLHTATPATGTAAVNNELRIQSTHASGYGGKAIVNLLTSQYGNSGIYMGDNATFSSQPSYIEHVDSSNMLKYKSTGNHSMLVGTATKMSIGSSTTYFSGNNVGIGTTSPSHQLEVGLSSSVSLANQPAIPLMVSNDGNSVDGRVFIQVKNDVVNTASAIGAGIKMTAANVTSGTAAYDSSLIFLQSKSPGNQTIHSAPQNIKFYVDNDGTTAGEGTGYNNYGDLAFELQTDGEAIFNYNVGIGTTTPSSKLEVYRDSSSYVANFADTDTRASLKLRSSSNGDGQITFSQGASASSIIQTSNVLATTPRNLHLNPFGGNVSIGTTTPSSTKKLDVAGNIQTEIIEYKKPDALNQFRGEVVTFGSQSGIAQGDVVVLNTSGQWVKAQANSGTTSKSLLGVAMGTTAAAGILVRGFVRCSATFSQSLNAGNPFYLSATTSGDATGTIPTTTGHIARIVGYATGVTAEMYFCPDNTFVEIA